MLDELISGLGVPRLQPGDEFRLLRPVQRGREGIAASDVHDLPRLEKPQTGKQPSQTVHPLYVKHFPFHIPSSIGPIKARYPPPSETGVGDSATSTGPLARPSSSRLSARTASKSPRSTPTER